MLKILFYFIITVPCWIILVKDMTNKEYIKMVILIIIFEMAAKYLLP